MRPREDPAQRLLLYNLCLDPAAAGSTEFIDQEGNSAVRAWFAAPVKSLGIHSRFQVETRRANPFDFLLEGLERVPAAYPEALQPVLCAYTEGPPSGAVEEFARAAAQEAGGGTLEFLRILNRRIFDSLRYRIRDHGRPLAAGQTLQAGEGSCRDFAVLFAEACRTMRLAARFVSGYDTAAADGDRADMHAWAEVYLPGGGWRGYDPSRALAVGDSYVAVAASLTPELAAPVTGSHGGNGGSVMETAIRLTVE